MVDGPIDAPDGPDHPAASPQEPPRTLRVRGWARRHRILAGGLVAALVLGLVSAGSFAWIRISTAGAVHTVADSPAVNATNGTVIVSALGPPPTAQTAELRQLLNQNGMSGSDLAIALVVGGSQQCPAGGDTCDPMGS